MNLYNNIGDVFLVEGKRIDLPANVGAMLGYQRAPDITNTTPFASTTPTLGLRKLPGTGAPSAPLSPEEEAIPIACRGLRSRVAKYGDLDPNQTIRTALIAKCEEQTRLMTSANVGASGATEGGPASSSIDPKLLAAGAIAVLVVGAIAIKKLKKR